MQFKRGVGVGFGEMFLFSCRGERYPRDRNQEISGGQSLHYSVSVLPVYQDHHRSWHREAIL